LLTRTENKDYAGGQAVNIEAIQQITLWPESDSCGPSIRSPWTKWRSRGYYTKPGSWEYCWGAMKLKSSPLSPSILIVYAASDSQPTLKLPSCVLCWNPDGLIEYS
jgi:hypothetical protein